MYVLGIETSCDETSVAVLEEDGTVRVSLIASQIERHQPFGGVVPEIASREHLIHMRPLIEGALERAGVSLAQLDAIAVTAGPGLIGALLVGVAAAQGLSYGLGIPLVATNHLEGHIFSSFLTKSGRAIELPSRFLSLVLSGGHSSIYDVRRGSPPSITMLTRTRDDAAGEIFDKVGKVLGLPYPGGPHVERVASTGSPIRFAFPLARFKDDSEDFSFSGLKSKAISMARQEGLAQQSGSIEPVSPDPETLADFCASFQKAIGDQIIERLTRVWDRLSQEAGEAPTELGLAGGVAANGALRQRITDWCDQRQLVVRLPERKFCTDNAAMIAFAGLQRLGSAATDPRAIKASSRMAVGGV